MLTEVSLARFRQNFIAGKPVKVVVAAVKKRRELYCDVNKSLFNDWLNLKHWLTKLTYSNLLQIQQHRFNLSASSNTI